MNKNYIFSGVIGLLIIIILGLIWYMFVPHFMMMNHMKMMERWTTEVKQWEDIPFSGYSQSMADHCVTMTEMKWCERYNALKEDTEAQKQEILQEESDFWELPVAKKVEIVELQDGDTYTLEVSQVQKEIGNDTVRMLAYNGSVPWPILKAPEWAKITLNFVNKVLDFETTLHSHWLRQDYKMDGVPKEMKGTQDPVKFGETFTYEIEFPDSWVFWYHPHIREDLQQELWLSGNYVVTPTEPDYWNPVNREETLILDDILIEDWKIAPISSEFANYILMGRFGNTMLINGETDYKLQLEKWEVIRLNLTNVSNTRVYNFEIPWVKIKRVWWDIGKYEREEFVESIVIAPAERYIIEVYFPEAWEFEIQNNTPVSNYTLWKIIVSNEKIEESYIPEFENLRINNDIISDIDNFRQFFDAAPDKEIELDMDMWMMNMWGMLMEWESHGGIEWEDEMWMMNKMHTSKQVDWDIIEKSTGKKNMDINWEFQKWDIVKIRIQNKEDGMHPMQHPIHFHGQRFLVLSENGTLNNNLVWKDTALVKTDEYIDILIDMSNPWEWMAHCHIAEHLTAGMMMNFSVTQ